MKSATQNQSDYGRTQNKIDSIQDRMEKDAEDLVDEREKLIRIWEEELCEVFDISYKALYTRWRNPDLVHARAICYYILYDMGYGTLGIIGKRYGVNHPTVHYTLNKLKERLKNPRPARRGIAHQEQELRGRVISFRRRCTNPQVIEIIQDLLMESK